MSIKFLTLLCLIFTVLIVVYFYNLDSSKKIRMPLTELNLKSSDIKIMGFIPFWDQENAFSSFTKNQEKFDFISLFWYKLNPDGTIEPYDNSKIDPNIIRYAQDKNVMALLLIANLESGSGENWDYQRVDKVIGSPADRKRHIADLMHLVQEQGFDGIDIDYENLKQYQRDNFSLFIEELAAALHKDNKILGVAIHPKTGEFKPEEDYGAHGQDLSRISKAADQLYFMTYLEHGTHSQRPGPAGSPIWISKTMDYSLNSVETPNEKVFMGIGLFGLSWKENPDGTFIGENSDLSHEYLSQQITKHQIHPMWNESANTPSFTFEDENGKHVIWFENKQSIDKKIELANELQIGGLAFWRLGGEDQEIWRSIK